MRCIRPSGVPKRSTIAGSGGVSGTWPVSRHPQSFARTVRYSPSAATIGRPACIWPAKSRASMSPRPRRKMTRVAPLPNYSTSFVTFHSRNQCIAHAWLSAVLTPLARHTFDGPTPLHVFDANAPGSGKTLLAELVSNVTMGDNIARMANPRDDDEARKRITALAIAGDSLVLIDNVNGGLGCSALDAALTGTRWQDRVLGSSQMIDLPLLVTWLASGNNVVLRADTSRRALHIRLRSNIESPESRTGFRYPNVRAYVRANRGKLLSAALTILRAWFVAGRPKAKLPAWGSFEDWSGVVRQAIVFAGQPDPAATRQEFVATADRDVMALRAVL